jgi:hypothetical protein
MNEVLVIVDYQEGGSSNNMFRQYLKNPKGFAFIRKQRMMLSKSRKRKMVEAIHYVSSSLISGNKNFIKESPKKVLTILAIPFGILWYGYILYKTKNKSQSKEL